MNGIVIVTRNILPCVLFRMGKMALVEINADNIVVGVIEAKVFKKHPDLIKSLDDRIRCKPNIRLAKYFISIIHPSQLPVLFKSLLAYIHTHTQSTWIRYRSTDALRIMNAMGTPFLGKTVQQCDNERFLILSKLVPYTRCIPEANRRCLMAIPEHAEKIILSLEQNGIPKELALCILTYL